MPDENPYAHRYAQQEQERERSRKERHKQKRRKVARDGAERGAATGPLVGIVVALAVQYGLPPDTATFLVQPATIAAFVALLTWLARIAEALIADGPARDEGI